jgi:hypothetical protein
MTISVTDLEDKIIVVIIIVKAPMEVHKLKVLAVEKKPWILSFMLFAFH